MTLPLTAWPDPPHPIAILSDFGQADGYVGILKGAIASVNTAIPIIDLTHDIPPQDVRSGRFVLANAIDYFPLGTVFLAVVDPGVGSLRRPLAVAIDRGWLVGPDNGLLSGAWARSTAQSAVILNRRSFWRVPNPSHTFHGRDLFAPVAAHLASGVPIEALGEPIALDALVSLSLPPLEVSADGQTLVGEVQYIDRFGNAVSTIPNDMLAGRSWRARVTDSCLPTGGAYSHVPLGHCLALEGSHGWVELACYGGSAAATLGLQRGDRVVVELLS
jgi:S-adenosylmethionine hydrolase